MAVLEFAGEDIWQFYCCRLRKALGADIWMAGLELAGRLRMLLSEDIWLAVLDLAGEDIWQYS